MSNALRIYEIYGGGGNTGAPYSNDYVTIYNSFNTSINLSDYHLQYSSAAGTFNATLQVNLSGSISGHGYYLIQMASNSSAGQMLPAADASNLSVNLSASTGKLTLVYGDVLTGSVTPSTPGVVDFVGYGGNASASEGAAAASPGSRNSITRLLEGGQDTDNNANDFAVTAPAPRNSASPHNSVPCYVTGTRILTSCGEVAVEVLAVGDLVVTASGEHRPIKWIGHRRTNCSLHPRPESVLPIRIMARAFGDGLPHRDLLVSPGHHLFVNGMLIPAERLVNGWSVRREDETQSVIYWHIELDSHDILLAEGLPAESYLDCNNRGAFENSGVSIDAHPDFTTQVWKEKGYAPQALEGEKLTEVRRRLMGRAGLLDGPKLTDPGLQLFANGELLTPSSVIERQFCFRVPEGCRSLKLVSRCAVLAHVMPENTDRRRLGVSISNLVVDGAEVALDDPQLASGWHPVERQGERPRRWTNGRADLPVGRAIEFNAWPLPSYGHAAGANGQTPSWEDTARAAR